MLDHTVDRVHSYYRVHRGLMDITLKKVQIIPLTFFIRGLSGD